MNLLGCLSSIKVWIALTTLPAVEFANFTVLADAFPSYITRTWESGDGLPMNDVTAVLQTRDGYLWLGTRSSLVRFDGVRFAVFDASNSPNTGSPHVTSLFEGKDGVLWIGHEDGAVTRYQGGEFFAVTNSANWRGGKVYAIGADRKGDVWLVSQEGELARVKDGFVISPSSPNVTRLLSVAQNPAGGIWVQRGNEICELHHDQLTPLDLGADANTHYAQGIGASRDGGLWAMIDFRMRKWREGKWIDDLGEAPWGNSPIRTLVETKDGCLVAGTIDHGIYVVCPRQGVVHFCRTNGFSSDWVRSMCEDHEGNIWAGTGNGGLAMLRRGNISAFEPPDRWQGRAVLSVAASSNGTLWVGTEGAGLYSYRDGAWKNFGDNEGLRHHYIWSVVQDADGAIWAGSWGGGLFKLNTDNGFSQPTEWAGFSAATPAILPRDGGLLVGSSKGLVRDHAGTLSWLGCAPELDIPDIRAMAET